MKFSTILITLCLIVAAIPATMLVISVATADGETHPMRSAMWTMVTATISGTAVSVAIFTWFLTALRSALRRSLNPEHQSESQKLSPGDPCPPSPVPEPPEKDKVE